MAALSQGLPYLACQHCTQHCQQIHGQGSSPCSRTPSFFSLLPPFPSCTPCSLPIPPAFLGGKNIRVDQTSAPGEHLYSEVQLEGPSGATWAVAMQGTSLGNLAFTTGWQKFVKDHSLVAGDLLFFKLLSRGCFAVSIYGTDGCEKAEAFTTQNSGARLASNEQMSKKRAAGDNRFQDVGVDADTKKRKVNIDTQVPPLIIDIDDDDDEDECKEFAAKPHSSNDCQVVSSSNDASIVQADIAESRDTCILDVEGSHNCMIDSKECLQPIPVDVPLTPNNADKGILINKMQIRVNSLKKEEGTSDQDCLVLNSGANGSEQEAALSEDEDAEQHNNQKDYEEMSSESDSGKKDSEDSLYCTDEATQQDRMNDVKDYMTEVFISKRRPVSEEERQKALQAAKGFRSNLPHLRKLMLESHVYRGFWLSLALDFAIKYLPQEIHEATLLDVTGKAWSARWLGARNGLSGGWRKFSLDHGLEEGDVCVFEVIDRKKPVMKVHIFRVVELKNGLPGRDHYLHKPPYKPFLDYKCRKPSTSVKRPSTSAKKMRGAIGSFHSSTLSSRLKQRNQAQAEDKTCKSKDDTHSISEKAVYNNHVQTTKNMVKSQSSCEKAELINRSQTSKDMVKSQSSCEKAELINRSQTSKDILKEGASKNLVNMVASKALRTNGTDEGGCSSAERSLQKNVDVSAQGESKIVSGCDTSDVSLSLQTPPKPREPVPESLRTRPLGLASARQLDPVLKGTQSGLQKATNKEHPDGSKLNSCRKYYSVERLYNRRKGAVEEEFLVDLDVNEPVSKLSSKVKKDGSAWWVPLSHFTKDKTSCHL